MPRIPPSGISPTLSDDYSAPQAFDQHEVTVRVQQVFVNRRPACAPIVKGQNMVSRHIYPTWFRRVDGTGPPPFRYGGHFFVGFQGRAGGLNMV